MFWKLSLEQGMKFNVALFGLVVHEMCGTINLFTIAINRNFRLFLRAPMFIAPASFVTEIWAITFVRGEIDFRRKAECEFWMF